jgi:putative phosphoserine phosphatase/1-acylglycerol-3-phosphate O-acyltransferase
VAVNADPRLALIAGLRRWPRIHFDAPPGVPEFLGIEPMDAVRRVVRPEMFPYARFDIAGTHHIPRTGPALIVANHRSYFDVPAIGLTVMKGGRIPRGLAKKELFDAPVVGQLARAFGQIMVDRKGSPTQVMAEVITALRAGEVIVLTPEGTIPRGAAFYRTKLKGKTGAARLAAATRVPVIPVGIWGTEKVWPRSARLPNMTNILHPPLVQVRVGPPVEGLRYGAAKADTATIMDAIVALLPEEASREREPTENEIALATPPGGKGA